MTTHTAQAVICGAGIAGIAAAYHLAVEHGTHDVVLVDAGDPLAMTSDKSTECYRNWWPGPGGAMVALMNRSIDLLEELAHASDNRFGLNRRGYVYATMDSDRVELFAHAATEAASLGAGAVRYHRGQPDDPVYAPAPPHGFTDQPDGVDLITDQALLREYFPYLSDRTVAVLHARRCGWFSAQQFGMLLLEQARAAGVRLVRGEVSVVDTRGGRVQQVQVATDSGTVNIATPCFVNAAGPLVRRVGHLLDIDLPIFSELHLKLALQDERAAVPRHAPMLICADPITLQWSDDEREFLAADADTRWMTEPLPAGMHLRPEGGGNSDIVLMLWDYHSRPVPATFPIAIDETFTELVLRGLTALVPALRPYAERLPRPYIDGGYYTKTRENRPLIGPLPVEGAYISGAYGGFGLMAACAAGELVAAHITESPLPAYAPAFALDRYKRADYQALLETWSDEGQL